MEREVSPFSGYLFTSFFHLLSYFCVVRTNERSEYEAPFFSYLDGEFGLVGLCGRI